MQSNFFTKFGFWVENIRVKCYKNHINRNVNKWI